MLIKDFQGKLVFLVGGSSGIGLAVARLLAERGADLVIFSRSKEKLEGALDEVESRRKFDNQRFAIVQLDISQRGAVENSMENSVRDYGIPDILINSAGRARPDYFINITYSQFEETMRINLFGIWNTVSLLVPYMQKKGGYIVNVSSMAGLIPVFGYTDYCASKAGIIAFSKVLRSELKAAKIAVSVLLPTDTDTPGFAEENKTKPYETKAISGWSKVAHPDKIALGLIKGMRKGKFLIIPTFMERIFYLIDRLWPHLVECIMDGDIRKVRRRMEG